MYFKESTSVGKNFNILCNEYLDLLVTVNNMTSQEWLH